MGGRRLPEGVRCGVRQGIKAVWAGHSDWDKGAMDDEGVRERCKGMTQQGWDWNGSCLHGASYTTDTLPTLLQRLC